ncbi:DUF2637 domain-containing protein [Isoptericola sp. NPDC057191]|uniref:DUF2637 domain-containing protein n=1 Tax=Isoptericola sp. NPDC057191 TaxID=3346041 RepID=UPI0036324927
MRIHPRINPDSRPVLAAVAIGTALVFLAWFALSSVALFDVGLWGNVPVPLSAAVPVMLDVALVVYSLSALVRRSRGQSARYSWTLLAFFTVVSLVGNATHALGIPEAVQPIVGAVVVALAPLAALASLGNLAGLVIAAPGARILPTSSAPVMEEVTNERAKMLDLVLTISSEHHQSKRSPENVRRVLDMLNNGATQKEAAETLGWSHTLVQQVVRDARPLGLLSAA